MKNLLGSANPAIATTCAAPKRDAPAALQLLKTPIPASQKHGAGASRTLTIFHGWVRTVTVHAVSPKPIAR
jgi:hypothetical protein